MLGSLLRRLVRFVCMIPNMAVDIIITIIIMVTFKCYFSREHMCLSLKNGVNIKLGKQTD